MGKWAKLKIALAVGKTIFTGKPAKIIDKVQTGTEIADKIHNIAKEINGLIKSKN